MHDFKKFPELTNQQMETLYFESPHKQIIDTFTAKCVKVTDGDTIRVKWDLRNFDFPVRFLDIAAPELNEPGGVASQQWLERRLLGKDVDIIIDYSLRVDKWGRLLGQVYQGGGDVGMESMLMGQSVEFGDEEEKAIDDIIKLPKGWT